MKTYFIKVVILILLLSFGIASAKEFYRYKDANGHTIIKDQINNEMIQSGYDILNESGMLKERIPPAKTLAQEAEEKQRLIEKKKAEIALQKQIRDDTLLLRQFSSVGDIIRNRDAQLLAIEQRIKIQKTKENLLILQLEDLQKVAATHERLGQKVPAKIDNDIKSTYAQIAGNEVSSKNLEKEKLTVAGQYEKNILRYKELESLRRTRLNEEQKDDPSEPVIYDCPDNKKCAGAWQLAQVYANDNATGDIEIITDSLIVTSSPKKDTDLALSFSRIPGLNGKQQIVFEVTCNNSEAGVELCKKDQVKSLKTNYLKELKERLK
ncbi:MAG: DUF4124 domain-containing protein [Gammaproteobacteria bacterium]|nr:DUF4124 domain-containing protein [Gammaproteobacteria bacterium]